MPKSTYTVKEVARLLGCSTNTVYKHLDNGSIKASRLGVEGRFRIPAAEVDRILLERGTALQTSTGYTIRKTGDSPDIFDWFIGFLSMGLGFTQFINPVYAYEQESLINFVPYINGISIPLFIGGVLLLGFDIYNLNKRFKHIVLYLFMGILYSLLGGIFISQNSVLSVGYLPVAAILIISAIKRTDFYARYMIFVNIMFLLLGLGFLKWPKSFEIFNLFNATSIPRNIFMIVWSIGLIISFYFSFKVFKRNSIFVKITAFMVGAISLLYAVVCFANGFWGRSIFGIITGTFSFIIPFADQFNSFGVKTKKEGVVSLLWLIGIFFAGSLVLRTVYSSFQKIVLEQMVNKVESASVITKNFMDGNTSILAAFSDDNELPRLLSEEKLTSELDDEMKQIYLSANSAFLRVIITNSAGKIIDTYPFYLQSQNVNISDRDYFTVPAATGRSLVTQFITPNSPGLEPTILISFPVLDGNNKFLGEVLASVDISQLQSCLKKISPDGETEFIVTDANGNYMLNPNPAKKIGKAPVDSLSMAAISGESGSIVTYDGNGIMKFQAYKKVDKYGWGIVAVQSQSSTTERYNLMGLGAFLFFVMATVGSLTFVTFLKRNG